MGRVSQIVYRIIAYRSRKDGLFLLEVLCGGKGPARTCKLFLDLQQTIRCSPPPPAVFATSPYSLLADSPGGCMSGLCLVIPFLCIEGSLWILRTCALPYIFLKQNVTRIALLHARSHFVPNSLFLFHFLLLPVILFRFRLIIIILTLLLLRFSIHFDLIQLSLGHFRLFSCLFQLPFLLIASSTTSDSSPSPFYAVYPPLHCLLRVLLILLQHLLSTCSNCC